MKTILSILLCFGFVFCKGQITAIFNGNRQIYLNGEKLKPISDSWHYDESIDSLVWSKNKDTVFVYHRPHKLRHFYYTWAYWEDNSNGWGENDIYLNHFPTKKEILKCCVYPFDKTYKYKKFDVTIQEVTDEQLHEILSPDILDRTPKTISSHYYYFNNNQ